MIPSSLLWMWLGLALVFTPLSLAEESESILPDRQYVSELMGVTRSKLSRIEPINDNETVQTNILGGDEAGEFAFPFAAAFIRPGAQFPSWRARCTGVLIHPYWVLTAAHCSPSPGSTVVLGQSNLEESVDSRGMSVVATVSYSIRHPNYFIDSSNGFDVALVRLAYPVHLRPVALDFSSDLTPELERQRVVSIGYGMLWDSQSAEALSPTLQVISQHLQPICECVNFGMRSNFGDDLSFISNSVLSKLVCYIPPSTSHRICAGDSGGPLMTGTDLDSYKVRGIANFGTTCELQLPDYYARVSAYAGWITSITGDLSSVGTNETMFMYPLDKEWKAVMKQAKNRVDLAAYKFCRKIGYAGGYYMRRLAFANGVQCFGKSLAVEKLTVTVNAPKSASAAELRRRTAIWARSKNCSTGFWTGQYKMISRKKKMIILCFPNNNGNIFTVSALKSDLVLDSSVQFKNELYDKAGLLFARSNGFLAGVWNGEVNDTHVGFALMGSSYTWKYTAPSLSESLDVAIPQNCSEELSEPCSLGMFLLPRGPSNFSDGWDMTQGVYPNNARRCWVIPPQSNTTLTTIQFQSLRTEQNADVIRVYSISGYDLETRQVSGKSLEPLFTLSGSTLPAKNFATTVPGQTLFVTFETNPSVQMEGFTAVVLHYPVPSSPCNPLLSQRGCAKVKSKCKWVKKRCVPR